MKLSSIDCQIGITNSIPILLDNRFFAVDLFLPKSFKNRFLSFGFTVR